MQICLFTVSLLYVLLEQTEFISWTDYKGMESNKADSKMLFLHNSDDIQCLCCLLKSRILVSCVLPSNIKLSACLFTMWLIYQCFVSALTLCSQLTVRQATRHLSHGFYHHQVCCLSMWCSVTLSHGKVNSLQPRSPWMGFFFLFFFERFYVTLLTKCISFSNSWCFFSQNYSSVFLYLNAYVRSLNAASFTCI